MHAAGQLLMQRTCQEQLEAVCTFDTASPTLATSSAGIPAATPSRCSAWYVTVVGTRNTSSAVARQHTQQQCGFSRECRLTQSTAGYRVSALTAAGAEGDCWAQGTHHQLQATMQSSQDTHEIDWFTNTLQGALVHRPSACAPKACAGVDPLWSLQ
jgi:hypothetical protein